MKEIERLNSIVSRIEKVKEGCSNIQKYLDTYTIKSKDDYTLYFPSVF